MESHEYEVNVKWKSGRLGEMSSPVLDEKLECATPPEFPEGVAGIWSPEHLFVASINSCLMTTFLAIAENSKLDYESFSCKAKGILAKEEGKFMIVEVILEPEVKVKNEEDAEKANKILEKSERACLISNSVKSKISMKTKIISPELDTH